MDLKTALEGRFKLPDLDSIQSDLCSFGFKFTSQGTVLLESKQDLKKRGQRSPDLADAIALTFFAGPEGIIRGKDFHRELKYELGQAYQ